MYLSLNQYLRSIFGERVQKISLDAGFTCPNRDGTKGRGGCIYCDARGSGTGAYGSGKDIAEQMKTGINWAVRRYSARKFIAYFQSFCNTYGPVERLEAVYTQALVGPEVVGLSIGTRPDCVDKERLELISRLGKGRMVWMEYGLQSASDTTLARINRKHTVSDFVRAVESSKKYGLMTCAHVIFGLPGEDRSQMEDTIRLLSDIQVEGIKFHHLYIVKNTELNRLYRAGNYKPITQENYVEMVAWALATLPKGTVIQRLTGDPPRNELVVPDWSLDKRQIIDMIHDRIKCPCQTLSSTIS
ncbi:MAG: TIGR01212 family radical SAM protein [Thermodesulfobacteriota bacterium]|nr:TIGR01212 family radical SAM protein [Thermodesulfobacteriota bacterium]